MGANQRSSNRPGVYGGLNIDSCGSQNDLFENDSLTVNRADDYTLAHALALRGYDVKLKEPTPRQVEMRKKERDARNAKAHAKAGGAP